MFVKYAICVGAFPQDGHNSDIQQKDFKRAVIHDMFFSMNAFVNASTLLDIACHLVLQGWPKDCKRIRHRIHTVHSMHILCTLSEESHHCQDPIMASSLEICC